jgi:hypothetical protein
MSLSNEELNNIADTYDHDELMKMIKNSKGSAKKQKDKMPKLEKGLFEKFTDTGEDLAHSLLGGLTLGYGQKGLAKVGALIPQKEKTYDEKYREIRDALRAKEAQAYERSPIASTIGSIAGGAKLPMPASSATKASAAGAGYGLLSGMGHNDKDQNTIVKDAIDALPEAGFGGAGGALGQKLNKYLFGTHVKPSDKIKETIALEKEFKVDLSKSKRTGTVDDLLHEEKILEGRYGKKNQERAFEQKQITENQLQKAIEDLTPNLKSKGEALRSSIEEIQNSAAKHKKRINAAYETAKDNVTTINKDKLEEFPKIMEQKLKNSTYVRSNQPEVYGELDAFKELFDGKDINFNQFEGWKQGLNTKIGDAIKNNKSSTKNALQTLSKEADEFMDSYIEKSLVQGDKEVLEAFKKARGLRKEYGVKFEASNPKEIGQKFIQDIVENAERGDPFTNEQIVNNLFGTAEGGFPVQAVNKVKALKKHLSPEEFQNVVAEFKFKLLGPLRESLAKPTFKPGTYLTNLDKTLKGNKTLVETILSKEDISQLHRIGKLADIAKTVPQNPSGTANKAYSLKSKLEKLVYNVLDTPGVSDIKNLFTKQKTPEILRQEILKGVKVAPEQFSQPARLVASQISELGNINGSKFQNANLAPKKSEEYEEESNLSDEDIDNLADQLSPEEIQELLAGQQQGYAEGGSVQYKEGSGEHEHGVEAHFNRHELAIMDEYQRGRSIDEKTKLPEYSVLGLMAEKNPNIVHQLIQDFAEAHSVRKAEHEHLHGKLAEDQYHGRFGDTELALIPHNLANLFDEAIGNVTRNPEDGKREYFWGSIAGLVSRALPTIIKGATTVGSALGRMAMPALKTVGSIAQTAGRMAMPALRTVGSTAMSAGRAAMPVLKTVGQTAYKYGAPIVDIANKTGITSALGQAGGQYIMDKISPQKPQEMIVDESFSPELEQLFNYQNNHQENQYTPPEQQQNYQQQYMPQQYQQYNQGYAEGGAVKRKGYSVGGQIADALFGQMIPGGSMLINGIDNAINNDGSSYAINSSPHTVWGRKMAQDNIRTDAIMNRNMARQTAAAAQAQAAYDKHQQFRNDMTNTIANSHAQAQKMLNRSNAYAPVAMSPIPRPPTYRPPSTPNSNVNGQMNNMQTTARIPLTPQNRPF